MLFEYVFLSKTFFVLSFGSIFMLDGVCFFLLEFKDLFEVILLKYVRVRRKFNIFWFKEGFCK